LVVPALLSMATQRSNMMSDGATVVADPKMPRVLACAVAEVRSIMHWMKRSRSAAAV
jgi:hypothetical protein